MIEPNLKFPDFEVSNAEPEAKAILNTIKMFFDSNVNSKVDLFKKISHPKLKRLAMGNSNKLYWMTRDEMINQSLKGLANARNSIPNFICKFKIETIKHFTIHDVIASIAVEWEMLMTDSTGNHCTCFHLVKTEDVWLIVDILDRGIEKNYRNIDEGN
jgi:hypothetical protein